MPLSNVQIDLLKEALFVLQRDRYSMPPTYPDYTEKSQLIAETYRALETIQTPTHGNA